MSRAPVVLFLFNRPEHARRTLEALERNQGAQETDLYIYSDGPRGAHDADGVERVRALISGVSGFRSVTSVIRDDNVGLTRNIVEGVSYVVERHGRVIVVEDDIVTAPTFLAFMNDALDRYSDDRRVWHISGWNYPIDPAGLPPFFFWQVMNCWGWSTWADRWRCYRKEPQRLVEQWSADRIEAFNLGGAHDFFCQVRDNVAGRIDSWAIFWYATIFENQGLCLNPTQSFVCNVGLDGSGTHGELRRVSQLNVDRLYCGLPPIEVAPDSHAIARVRDHLESQRPSFPFRTWRLVRRALGIK